MDRTTSDDHARRRAAFLLWLANLAVGVGIGTLYLGALPEGVTTRTAVFVCLALVSSVATLSLLPAASFWAAARWIRRPRLGGLAQAAVGAAFLCLLYADTVFFRILGYHFNGAVLNVMFTRGSEDAVHLGGMLWLQAAGVYALALGLEYGAWRLVYRRSLRRGPVRRRGPWARPVVAAASVLVCVLFVERSIYAAADLELDHEVNSASQLLPLYPRLRVSQVLPESIGRAAQSAPPMDIVEPGEPLAYPLAEPELDPEGPRPNVLFLVVDSWRSDCFTPVITPRLWEHSRGARVHTDHLAGGNGTRFGVFSMLYGLHGSYWFSCLEERRSPVMLDVLAEAEYEFAVFSSASMSFPEFRKTAWVNLPDAVHDDYPGANALQRDHQVVDSFTAWLGEREEDRPFFGFVLLDAAHQPYHADGGPFQPAAEELDYIELRNSDDPALVERMFNKYRNSLLACDEAAGRLLDALEASGAAEDTLIVVTGDHGEEFQENGFWGHTSNFTLEQVAVPFWMKGPGVDPGLERRPTSHLDLPATVLEFLGADPARRGEWTLGANLLEPPTRRDRSVSGWEYVGLHTQSGIFRVRLGGTHGFDVEVLDADWRLVPDQAGAWRREAGALQRLARETRRFLAPSRP